MDVHQANQIYDVLMECGAPPDDRRAFVDYAKRAAPLEWRFIGTLGFGGKFYFHDCRIRCNREDETDERIQIMAKANADLTLLTANAAVGNPV